MAPDQAFYRKELSSVLRILDHSRVVVVYYSFLLFFEQSRAIDTHIKKLSRTGIFVSNLHSRQLMFNIVVTHLVHVSAEC